MCKTCMQMQISPLWWWRSPRKHVTAACFVLVFLEAVSKARDMSPSQSSKGTYAKPDPSQIISIIMSSYPIDDIWSCIFIWPTPNQRLHFSAQLSFTTYITHTSRCLAQSSAETYLHQILQHNINLLTLDTLEVHERGLSSLNTTRHYDVISN